MKRFFKNCQPPENLEILFMLTLGIMFQMADGSPFSLKARWMLVWNTELPAENFSLFVQKFIKTLLSMIVVIRCVTTYAYIVSAMLVISCLLRNTSPKLMLFWLLVAGLKSVCMTFLEALTGVYVCSAFGKIRKACIEFFISKALEIIFATYLWGNVLNIYQDMERKAESKRTMQTKEQMFMQRVDFGLQRARSLVDESTLYKTACLNNFECKDVPQIVLQMLRAGDEMSQDSLLSPGMMLASVSNLGSFDNLKTSQSLGELGYVDLGTTQVVGLEEDECLSHQEKALKFLKLTKSDVKRIKLNKTPVENDIYMIDQSTWNRVEAGGAHITKPKHERTQVFIRDIPQVEPGEANSGRTKMRKKSFDFKFGFSFSNLFNEKQSDEEQDEELIFSQDEDEGEDYQPAHLIMSNLEEGVINPNRLGIVLRQTKGTSYAGLYRQEFMSVIGPEVFDRACKLPKVTSLAKIRKTPVVETEDRKVMIFEDDWKLKMEETSSEDLHLTDEQNFGVAESSSREKIKYNLETSSVEDENGTCMSRLESNKPEHESAETSETREDCSDDSEPSENNNLFPSLDLSNIYKENCEEALPKPCFRKRRIIIKRVGRRKGTNRYGKSTSEMQRNSKNDDTHFAPRYKSKSNFEAKDTAETRQESEKQSPSSGTTTQDDNHRIYSGGYDKQIYFLTDLLQKPLLDVLITYCELRRRVHVQKKPSTSSKKYRRELFNILLQNYHLRWYERILKSLELRPIQNKVWKSKVLKTVEIRNRENSAVALRRILNVIKRESVFKKLFKYERENLLKRNGIFLPRPNAKGSNWLNADSITTDVIHVSDDSIVSKLESEISLNQNIDSDAVEISKGEEGNWEITSEVGPGEFRREKIDNPNTTDDSNSETPKTDSEFTAEVKGAGEMEAQDTADSKVLGNDPEGESICSEESEEPISLYYSKAANLASPLFDMKRFIYPDHIHYSYKHVNKKGFDVDINGGFPLLVRESLTMGTPVKMGSKLLSKHQEFEITSRPMDLSFATTNAFAEWQNNDQNDLDVVTSKKRVQKCINGSSGKKERNSSVFDLSKSKKIDQTKRSKKNSERNESRSSFETDFAKSKPKPYEGNFNNIKYLYSTRDYTLIEKLLKMHVQFNNIEFEKRRERKPVHISSTELHSNKGRVSSTYNPAIILQQNKTRSEKKKTETQKERTKDMFARLEREALLQSKNVQKSFGPNRNT